MKQQDERVRKRCRSKFVESLRNEWKVDDSLKAKEFLLREYYKDREYKYCEIRCKRFSKNNYEETEPYDMSRFYRITDLFDQITKQKFIPLQI